MKITRLAHMRKGIEVRQEFKNRDQSLQKIAQATIRKIAQATIRKDKRINIRIAAKDLTAPTNAGVRVCSASTETSYNFHWSRIYFLYCTTFHDPDLASSEAFSNALSIWGRWVISGTT